MTKEAIEKRIEQLQRERDEADALIAWYRVQLEEINQRTAEETTASLKRRLDRQ